MKKFAVVISGCGHLDGAEIHEVVSSMMAIDTFGAAYTCFAPNIEFMALDYITKKVLDSRNVMVEAARIARGKVFDLNSLNVDDFYGLILPGGYGIVTNFSNFAVNKEKPVVLGEIQSVVTQFFEKKKPIGAICIAPIILALVLGKKVNLMLTLGEASNSNMINSLGCTHVPCNTEDFVRDKLYNIFSTPAYMREDRISLVYKGIFNMIEAIINI